LQHTEFIWVMCVQSNLCSILNVFSRVVKGRKLEAVKACLLHASGKHVFRHSVSFMLAATVCVCACVCLCVCVKLARTIYIRCIYDKFGWEITKYTVIYGAYIRFWPSLCMCSASHRDATRYLTLATAMCGYYLAQGN